MQFFLEGWRGVGGVPQGLNEYAGWYFRVYGLVRLLRRESSMRGQVGWLSTHWVGGEGVRIQKKMRVGSPLSEPQKPGKFSFTRSVWDVPLLTSEW